MFLNFSLNQWVRWFWGVQSNFRRLIRGEEAFIIITPPFLRRQIILSRVNKLRIHSLVARDNIDIRTLYDIFLEQPYSQKKFIRSDLIRNKWVIFDFGANVGYSSLFFMLTIPNSTVIALEPDVKNFQLAKWNTRDCKSRIYILHGAIGPRPGVVNITNESAESDAYRVSISDSENGVRMYSPNELAKLHKFDDARKMYKIDIEGFEKELFSENTEWFSESDVVIIEPHDWMLPKSSGLSGFLKLAASNERDFLISGENVCSVRCSSRDGLRK